MEELQHRNNVYVWINLSNLHDPEGFRKFKDSLELNTLTLGYTNPSAIWTLFVNAKHVNTKISKPPSWMERHIDNPKKWKHFSSKFEPVHYTSRTIICPRLLPVGKEDVTNPEHPMNKDLRPGLYSARLSLLLSNPCWHPSNDPNLLFHHGSDENDQCEGCVVISNLQFIREHDPVDPGDSALYALAKKAYKFFSEILEDKAKSGTVSCF